MSNSLNGLGWKAFFALLMTLQVVIMGVMWRTYDAIQETSYNTRLNTYQIKEVILPRLQNIDGRYSSSQAPLVNGPSGK